MLFASGYSGKLNAITKGNNSSNKNIRVSTATTSASNRITAQRWQQTNKQKKINKGASELLLLRMMHTNIWIWWESNCYNNNNSSIKWWDMMMHTSSLIIIIDMIVSILLFNILLLSFLSLLIIIACNKHDTGERIYVPWCGHSSSSRGGFLKK